MLKLEDSTEVDKKPNNPLNNEEEVQSFMIGKGVQDAERAISEIKGDDDSYTFSDYQKDTFKQNMIEGARIVADMEKWAIRGLNIGDFILGKKPTLFADELDNVENIEKELVEKHKEIQERQNIYSNSFGKLGKLGLLATDMAQNIFLDPSDYVFGVATGISKATRLMAKLPFIRYVYNQNDVYDRTPLDYDYNDAKQVAIMAGLTGAKFIPSAYRAFKNKSADDTGIKDPSGTIKDTKFLEWVEGKDKGFYPSPITILAKDAKNINHDKVQERELVTVDTDYLRSIAFREDNNLPLSIYSNDTIKATSANIDDTFEVYFMKVKEWQEETGEKDFPSFNDFKAFVEEVDKEFPLPLKKAIEKGTFQESDYNNIIEQITGYKTQEKQEQEKIKTFTQYVEDLIRNKDEAERMVRSGEEFANYQKEYREELFLNFEETYNNAVKFLDLGEREKKEYLELAKELSDQSLDGIWGADDGKTFFEALDEMLDYPEFEEKGLTLDNNIILMDSLFTKKGTKAVKNLRKFKTGYGRGSKDVIVISTRENDYYRFNNFEQEERRQTLPSSKIDGKENKGFNFFTLGSYERILKDNPDLSKINAQKKAETQFGWAINRVVLSTEQEIENFLYDIKNIGLGLNSKTEAFATDMFDEILSQGYDMKLSLYFRASKFVLTKEQNRDLFYKLKKDFSFFQKSEEWYGIDLEEAYNELLLTLTNKLKYDKTLSFKMENFAKNKEKILELLDNVDVNKITEILNNYLSEVEKIAKENYSKNNIKTLQDAIEIPQVEATKILNISNKNFDAATNEILDTLDSINTYFKRKVKDVDYTSDDIDNYFEKLNEPVFFLQEKHGIIEFKGFAVFKNKTNSKYEVLVLEDNVNIFKVDGISYDKPSEAIYSIKNDLYKNEYFIQFVDRKIKYGLSSGKTFLTSRFIEIFDEYEKLKYRNVKFYTQKIKEVEKIMLEVFGEDSEEYARVKLNRSVPDWIGTAVQNYNRGSFYREFNQKVIDGNYKNMHEIELQTLRNFEEYFSVEKPIDKNMVFYRGFRLDYNTENSWFEDVVKNLKVGDIMGNRSFLSVSHTPVVSTYFSDVSNKNSQSYFMNIEVPKGTVVLPFGRNANFTSENELLLNKDNAFYIKDIKEIEYNGQKVKIIDAILIDGNYKEFLSKDDKRPYYRVDTGKQLYIKRHMQGMELPFEFEFNNLILKNATDIEAVKEVLNYYNKLIEIRKDAIMKEILPVYNKIREIRRKGGKDGIKTLSIIRKNLSKKLFHKYGITDSKLETLEYELREAYEKGEELTEDQIRKVASGIIYRDIDTNIENIFKENADTFNRLYNKVTQILKKDYEEKVADYDENKINERINGFKDLKKFVEEKTNLLGEGGKIEDTSSNPEIIDYKKALWYITKDNFLNNIFKNIDFGLSFVRSNSFIGTGVQGSAMRSGKNLYMLVNTDSNITDNKPLFPIKKPFNTVTVDTSKTGIIIHELGHILDYYLDDGTNKNTGYFILANAFKEHGLDLYSQAKSGELNYWLSDYARMGISNSQNNPDLFAREVFAEAFNLAFNPNTIFFDELDRMVMGTFKKEVMKAFKLKLDTQGKLFKFEDGQIIYSNLEIPSPAKYYIEQDSLKIDPNSEKIKADGLYMKKNGIPFEKTSLGNGSVRLPEVYGSIARGLVPDIKPDTLIIDYGAGVGWKEQFKLRKEAGIKNDVIPYDKYADPSIADWTPIEDAIIKAKAEGKDIAIISSNVLNVLPIKEIFGENKDNAYVEDLVKELERVSTEYGAKLIVTVYEGEARNKYKPSITKTGTYQSNMPLGYYTKFFEDKTKLSIGKYLVYDPNKKYISEDLIKDNSYGKVVGGNRYKYIGDNQILVTDSITGEHKFTGIVDDWEGKFEPTIIKFIYPDGKFKVPSQTARQVYHSKHLFVENPNAPQYQLSKARSEKIDSELKRLGISKKSIGYESKWNEYLKQMNLDDDMDINYMIYKGGATEAKKAKIKEKKKEIKKVKATFKNLTRNEDLKIDVFEALPMEDKLRYMDYFNMQFKVKPYKKDIQIYNKNINRMYRNLEATNARAGGGYWKSSVLKDLIPKFEGEKYLFGKVDVQNTNIRYKDKSTGEQRQKTIKNEQVAYVVTEEKNGKRHLRSYYMNNKNEFELIEEIEATMRDLSARREEEYYKKVEKNADLLSESEAVKIEKEKIPANDPITIDGNLEKDYTNVINNLNNLTKKLLNGSVGIDVPLSVRNILRPMRYHFNNIIRYKAYDVKFKLWGDTKFNQVLDKQRMLNLKNQLSSKGLIEAMQKNIPLEIDGVHPEFIKNLRALWERAVQYKAKDKGVALDNEDFYMGIDTFYNKNLFQTQLYNLKEGIIDPTLKERLLENLKEEFIPLLEQEGNEEFLKQFFVDHTKTNRDKNGTSYLNHAEIADYYYKDRSAYVKMYEGTEREIEEILGNIIKNAIKEEIGFSILNDLKSVAFAKFDSEDAGKLASIDSNTKQEISKEVDYLAYDAGRIIARNIATSKAIVEDYNPKSKAAAAINRNPLVLAVHDFMAFKYLSSFNYLTEAPINSREVNKGLRDYGLISNSKYLAKSFNVFGQYGDMFMDHFYFVNGLKKLKDDEVEKIENLKHRSLMRLYLNQKMMYETDYSDFSKATQFNHKLGQIGASGQGFSDLHRKLLAEWSLYKIFADGLTANTGKEKLKSLMGVLNIDKDRFRDVQTALNVMDKTYLYELLFEKPTGDSEIEDDIKRLFNNIVEDTGKDFDIFSRATGMEESIITKLLLMYKRYALRQVAKVYRENTTFMDEDGIIYDNTRAGFKETFTAEHFIDNLIDVGANIGYALSRGMGRIAIRILMGAIGLGTAAYYATRAVLRAFMNGDHFQVTWDVGIDNLKNNMGIDIAFGGSTPIGSFINNIPYRYKLGARAGLGIAPTIGYVALATVSPEVVARSIDLYSLKKNMPSNISTISQKASFYYKNIYKQEAKLDQLKYDVPPLFLFLPRTAGAIFQLMLKDDELSSEASGIYDDNVDKNIKAAIATNNLVMASEVARNHSVAILPKEELDKLGIGFEEEYDQLTPALKGKYDRVVDYLKLDEKEKLIILHKVNDFNTEEEKEKFLMEQMPINKRF